MARSEEHGDYYRLTLDREHVDEWKRLSEAIDVAKAAEAAAQAEGDALDERIATLAAEAEERNRGREAARLGIKPAAEANNVAGVDEALRTIAAYDATDLAQAAFAERLREERAALGQGRIAAAAEAVEQAVAAMAEFDAVHGGKMVRSLVDRAVRSTILAWIDQGGIEGDAGEFCADVGFLPHELAREAHRNPVDFMDKWEIAVPLAASKRPPAMTADEARRLLPQIQEALGREAAANNAKLFGVQADVFTRGGAEPVYTPFHRTREGL
jgi:hypothetical protein